MLGRVPKGSHEESISYGNEKEISKKMCVFQLHGMYKYGRNTIN